MNKCILNITSTEIVILVATKVVINTHNLDKDNRIFRLFPTVKQLLVDFLEALDVDKVYVVDGSEWILTPPFSESRLEFIPIEHFLGCRLNDFLIGNRYDTRAYDDNPGIVNNKVLLRTHQGLDSLFMKESMK